MNCPTSSITTAKSGSLALNRIGTDDHQSHAFLPVTSSKTKPNTTKLQSLVVPHLVTLHRTTEVSLGCYEIFTNILPLSVYEFELHGRPLQIREMKLAANVDNFARQVYAALRDLENENMDIIYVESIEVDENTPEARVMHWLRNEEKAERGSPRNKNTKERSRTPGAMILLGLFSLAVGTILVIGERNLFSMPVKFQTEPMPNVGKSKSYATMLLQEIF